MFGRKHLRAYSMSTSALRPIDKENWDERKARHLLNRAGFGIPRERVAELAHAGPDSAVRSLVDFDGLPPDFRAPDFLIEPLPPEEIRFIVEGMEQSDIQQASNASNELQRESIAMLKGWWLARMLSTPWPLQEKLALLWHGHFATSASKVETGWFNWQLNQVFREHGSGNLKKLVLEVGQSPAMLQYLDNNDNVKGGPNENWARELFELFTLGAGHYSEEDIKNAARGFTGWSADHKRFVYRDFNHDTGKKKVLGRSGYFDGWDVVDVVFEQPACAEHFVRKVWSYFAYADPEPAIVSELADVLRNEQFEMKPLLSAMFMSSAFYSDRAIQTQVKSPVQLTVKLAYDLRLSPPPLGEMAQLSAQLGQDLFYPPNVKGWDGGSAWINTGAMLGRYNLPPALATAQPPPKPEMGTMVSAMYESEMMAKDIDMSGSLGRLLTALPEDKRKYVIERFGFNRPEYRRGVAEYIEAARKRPPWDPKRIFDSLTFTTAGSCVDALSAEFLNAALTGEQRIVLLKSLGAGDDSDVPIARATLSTDQMNGTLHLLFSMAEYQLC
jgi:hypothetical protein